jgi:hypothetical protein
MKLERMAWARFNRWVYLVSLSHFFGDAITIKPGLPGSFHLYAPSGYASRVTRAR